LPSAARLGCRVGWWSACGWGSGRAGLPRIRFHDLRHSCATLLLGEGVHPKIVSDLLGHSQIGITLDLYSHVTATMQAVAAEAMGRLLGGQDESR
jgi:integrase